MDDRTEPQAEHKCGPRREWYFEGAEETIDREARLQQLRLEPLVQELPDRHGGEAEHLLHHRLAEASQWKRTAHERHLVPEARRREARRRHREDEVQRRGELSQEFDHARVRLGILRRERTEPLLGLSDVPPDAEGPVRPQRNDLWF